MTAPRKLLTGLIVAALFLCAIDLSVRRWSADKGNQGVYDYYEQIKSQLADMVGSGVL